MSTPLSRSAVEARMLDLVTRGTAEVLDYSEDEEVEVELNFGELGLDSLEAIDLCGRLSDATGLALSATLIFDYPTPVALASYLGDQLTGEPAREISLGEAFRTLEAALATPTPALEARLHDLLLRLDGSATADVESDTAERIRAARGDELFALIDDDLRVRSA